MGVSGSGKSVVAAAVAALLPGADYIDADDLHPQANVTKMAAGFPLDDEDRWPWLAEVGEVLAAGPGRVMACSALKRVYRDRIRAAAPDTWFLMLDPPRGLLATRLGNRVEHFMPVSLLTSQLDTLERLEPDEAGLVDDARAEPPAIARAAVEAHRSWMRN